jgi:hypothetical protein
MLHEMENVTPRGFQTLGRVAVESRGVDEPEARHW